MRQTRCLRGLLLAPGWLWLLGFVALPVGVLVLIALATVREGLPPYRPGLDPAALLALADGYYADALLGSLVMAGGTAALCAVLGYPMALAIARSPVRWRNLLLLLVILPFWTGILLRLTAWIGILRDEGLLNAALVASGLIAAPLPIMHSNTAMFVGLVYCYLPFMILPLQARLAGGDPALEEAAADLGASPWRVFLTVTLPNSRPALWAGLALVFVPVSGEYVIPELLGPPEALTGGRVIWDEFFHNQDWPRAAALSLALLLLLAPAMALVRRAQ